MAQAMRLPVSAVRGWAWPDLVAAVADLHDRQNRCAGCGLTPDEQWWVTAELHRCPSCADREVKRKEIPRDHSGGWRVRFAPVEDELGMLVESAAARQTPGGMRQRKQVIQEHRRQQ